MSILFPISTRLTTYDGKIEWNLFANSAYISILSRHPIDLLLSVFFLTPNSNIWRGMGMWLTTIMLLIIVMVRKHIRSSSSWHRCVVMTVSTDPVIQTVVTSGRGRYTTPGCGGLIHMLISNMSYNEGN